MDRGIRSTERIKYLTAGATIGASVEFEACAGQRVHIEVCPRPSETNEVEMLWCPNGEQAPVLQTLRDTGRVMTGGWLLDIVLDGDMAQARKGRLYFARASAATGDVELRVHLTRVDLPPGCGGVSETMKRLT